MIISEDFKNTILNTKVDSFLEAIKEFNVEDIISSTDAEFTSRAVSLVEFYDDLLTQPGMTKEIASKAFVGMNELFVRRSILKAFMNKGEGVSGTLKQKSVQDFKSYLLYAANKFGDAKDIKAVNALVEKIKDEATVV